MGLLCAFRGVDVGVTDSKRVMAGIAVGVEGRDALWQQLRVYMENRFGSSQISVTKGAQLFSLSYPVTPSTAPVLNPLNKDQIRTHTTLLSL